MPVIMHQCLNCNATFAACDGHTCTSRDLARVTSKATATEDNWKHRAENMRCQTCMWYIPKSEKLGRCRFNAPTIKGWPVMFPGDWCGQHKLDENKV